MKQIRLNEAEFRSMIEETINDIVRGMGIPARRPIREGTDNPNMEYDWE